MKLITRYHLSTYTDASLHAILKGTASEEFKEAARKVLAKRTVPVTKPIKNG